jgi:diadenosine tetraphosphatase ApaH/serine/threonine PP2A family protein phosphatase
MPPTIVVGDVHGCLDELEDLLRLCGFGSGVRLVFVGDLVAKGPNSQGVVQLAREAGAIAVLGNHDAHVLRARQSEGREAEFLDAKPPRPEHRQVLQTLTARDWEYLAAMPLFARLGAEAEGAADTAVVHGGAVPGVPLEKQEREHLITLRSITFGGEPTKRIEGTPWGALWRGPERLVFGHDAVRGLQEHPMTTGLDTGCVYGQRLTALALLERRLVSVPAHRSYVLI